MLTTQIYTIQIYMKEEEHEGQNALSDVSNSRDSREYAESIACCEELSFTRKIFIYTNQVTFGESLGDVNSHHPYIYSVRNPNQTKSKCIQPRFFLRQITFLQWTVQKLCTRASIGRQISIAVRKTEKARGGVGEDRQGKD